MPVKADAGHTDAPQLERDVRAGGHRGDALPPLRCHFVIPVGVWPGAYHSANVIEDDRQVGDLAGEIGQVGQLRKINRSLQQQAHIPQNAGAGQVIVPQQTALHLAVLHFRVGIPAHSVANAAKAVGAGGLQSFQYRADGGAHFEVGAPDDGGGGAAFPIAARCAFLGNPLDELHLAYGAELLRPVGAVFGAGLNKHRGTDIVAAVDVGQQFGQQILLVVRRFRALHPEVMMRVADGQVGLPRGFRGKSQPVIAGRGHGNTSTCAVRGGNGPRHQLCRPAP